MTNYKILLLTSALFISGIVNADKNKGSRPAPFNKIQKTTAVGNCPNTTAQVDLNVNNVRARILNGGDMWWDPISQVNYYEVPVGSNKNSLYTGAIWIGGYDIAGVLKIAAQTYRQQGANDFWAGPISKDPVTGQVSVSDEVCNEYDKLYTITKKEVETFVATGEASTVIKEWPGNGNPSNGELLGLAPFFDADGNGEYDYTQGDYPGYNLTGDYPFDTTINITVCNDYLFGDKTLWWVFNDVGNLHTETNSENAIGLEVRAQAFGFNTPDEINNMTFYKYQIINRSSDVLNQTYIGQWADPDLGNAVDDYVGCDVSLGLGFVYNADPDDDGALGYGVNPPALGMDFFQGPLADPNDFIDNDQDGITDEPGEEIIMSKFVYYKNLLNNPVGNPNTTEDYYQYLSGIWLDGLLITYGEEGRNQANPPANYMFPGTTDPNNPTEWTMPLANIQGDDMRFLQSAGTFTLQPGAVNFVTTGAVWARTTNGGPLASLNLVKLADRKAQALFTNCFKVLDGPDAPDLAIRESDKQLLLSFENTKVPKVERYNEIDPTIPVQVPDGNGGFTDLTVAERSYKFQGYKLYQLKDKTVSAQELDDASKAKLIEQWDLKDGITEIVNFTFDPALNVWIPLKRTEDVNAGLTHTISIKTDYFTGQDLINYRPYYYMMVSYAYNQFRPFDEDDASFTQSKPFIQGRNNVKVYSGIPHKPFLNNGGTVLNASQGTLNSVSIRRIEGQGNGSHILDLDDNSVNEIFSDPFRIANPVYSAGRGPVKIGVYDPFKVSGGELSMIFTGVADTSLWYMASRNLVDTIDSSALGIGVISQEIISSKGLTVDAYQVSEPGELDALGAPLAPNNGFLDASIQYSNGPNGWLTGVVDTDDTTAQDWIRAGNLASDKVGDPNSNFESILGKTWSPYLITDGSHPNGSPKLGFQSLLDPSPVPANPNIRWSTLNGVDLVITKDKSKWTRSVVLITQNNSIKFDKRYQASVDKDGNIGNGVVSTDPNDADFIDPIGMGWFPGYAINVETGERLNIAFGEDSSDVANNGNDMIWNPSTRVYGGTDNSDSTQVIFGGKHYIYIFNRFNDLNARMPRYDYGARIDSLLTPSSITKKRNLYKSVIWTSLPVLSEGFSFSGNMPPGDVKIRLRVAKRYANFISENTTPVNNGNPYYELDIANSIAPSTNVQSVAESALDNVNVVPNPYYAYSSYEKTREDQLDSRIRFTNLPSKCTVSIYTINGTLVRELRRDVNPDVSLGIAVDGGQDFNLSSTLDWDMKNTAGIPIASGVYIIHIDAGSLGEKVIKWFGVMRPLDLDTF